MFNLNQIPNELKKNGLFCVAWRETKVPVACKVNDPSTFKSFEEARTIVDSSNKYVLGIGLFGSLVGIDIDDCIIDNVISEHAKTIIDYANTYTEKSPSGTGIRMFLFCGDKFDWRSNGYGTKNTETKVEIYQGTIDHRYLTITGDVIKNAAVREVDYDFMENLFKKFMRKKKYSAPINQAEIDKLEFNVDTPDDYYLSIGLVKDLILIKLWNTNSQSENVDQSSVDLNLLSRLAFWCNKNQKLMRDAFESCPYFKSKDNYHLAKWSRTDYSSMTINKAIETTYSTAYEKDVRYKYNGKY